MKIIPTTPAYVFDGDRFAGRVQMVADVMGPDIPVSYAIKSNSFLLHAIPQSIHRLEVCSPGELAICQSLRIPAERIIYSGVMKEKSDILEALNYGVDIMTAESARHIELLCQAQQERGADMRPQRLILRLTSGNQFGMEADEIVRLIGAYRDHPALDIIGIHYYSGTQKSRLKAIEKDIQRLENLLERLQQDIGYVAKLVEYGPGMAVSCFAGSDEACETEDRRMAETVAVLLRPFAAKYPLAIELGRFLAAPCGTYYTSVMDLKHNDDVNYALVDGGIHHLRYYGQTMAMQIPPMEVFGGDDSCSAERQTYAICGSLCTTADVLVREVKLPKLKIGDVIGFGRCGAYSVTEASVLFLSRQAPSVWLLTGGEHRLLRESQPTYPLNH